MSVTKGRGTRSWREAFLLVGGAAAVGLLAMAGLTSAPPDSPAPADGSGIGGQAGKRIFYLGTISFERHESGRYSFKSEDIGGGSTTRERDLDSRTAGTWAVSLEAMAYESELVTASGSASGVVTHSHSDVEHSTVIKAQEDCPGNRPPARPGTKTEVDDQTTDDPIEGTVRVAVMLSAAGGTYTVSLAQEEGREVVRHSHRSVHVTTRCNPAPEPEHTQNVATLPLPVMAFCEPKPWVTGDVLQDEYIYDDLEAAGSFCPGGTAEEAKEAGCSYLSRTVLKWKLLRKVSDCTARVDFTQGDVFLNDMPMPGSGEIPLSKGDVIRTGRKARAQLRTDPAVSSAYQVGGSSRMSFGRDPCDRTPTKDVRAELLTGGLYSWIGKLGGAEDKFMINNLTSAGVRGSLDLLKRLLAPSPLFAQEPPDNPGPEEAVMPEDWPSSGAAFYLWSDPSGAVGVRMFRGRARIDDPAAQKPILLSSGEFYRGPAVKRAKGVVVTLLGN